MKGDTSFSILSIEDSIHFIHEKNSLKLMYMTMSHCRQPDSHIPVYTQIGKLCHLQKSTFSEGKEGKLGLPFSDAVFIVLSHLYINICSKRVL